MMNPDGAPSMGGHDHTINPEMPTVELPVPEDLDVSAEAKKALMPVVDRYLELKNALVADSWKEARPKAQALQSALAKVNMGVFEGEAHDVWMAYQQGLGNVIPAVVQASDLEAARQRFIVLSEMMIGLANTFDPADQILYVQHCPMANNDQGADWLSTEPEIRNPYYGASMLTCGTVTNKIE
jgi:Cu(I)/Ag(I) efflux system membrane fusion protein